VTSAISACRICGASDLRRFEARELMFGTRERFDYAACAGCGCVQIAAIPADLARHYPAAYHRRVARPVEAGATKRRVRHALAQLAGRGALGRGALALAARLHPALAHYAGFLEPYRRLGVTPRQRILDVGAGGGQHVAALRAFGFARAAGIDPFVAADVPAADGGTLVRRGAIADAGGPFDLIELHHSLEHMPDQAAALGACRALLAPGGAVRVRVPTVTSEAWARYGADWVQLDAPRHLYLHSHASLGLVAKQAGLAIADLACDSTAFQFWGSEQYRRGVALDAPTSYAVDPAASGFSAADIAGFDAEARALNAAGRGDQIDVVLRPRTT
jgi:SAM-dependent methyltransferase